MKRVFLLMVVSALLVTLGFAQTPDARSNTDQANVKGCLGGSDGNYTVAEDGTRQIFKITTSSVDLKPHLGHDVKLTGHKASGAVSSGAADNSFAVTELNMISEHCAVAAAPAAAAPIVTVIPSSETVIAPAPVAAAPNATVSTPASDATAPAVPAPVAAAPARLSVRLRRRSSHPLRTLLSQRDCQPILADSQQHRLRPPLHPLRRSARPRRLSARPLRTPHHPLRLPARPQRLSAQLLQPPLHPP